MMDGRNCTGRKISLLNDISAAAALPQRKVQLPPLLSHAYSQDYQHRPQPPSRDSSCESTPSLAPQTPQLSRTSSRDSRSFSTPSPLTPSYNSFESGATPDTATPRKSRSDHHFYSRHHSYSTMDDSTIPLYPPIPDATSMMPSVYPMPQQLPPQQLSQTSPPQHQRPSSSPASEPSHVSTLSAASNSNKAQPKKNQYPCPMAKQVGCTDYFTTSGHAARHAKKHTGKKDAFCPECNKAFTRKDNMEQHRRTHQNGGRAARASNTSATTDDAKVKKPTKPASKKSNIKAEPQQFEAALEQLAAEQAIAATISPTMHIPTQVTAAHQQAQVVQQLAMEQAMMIPPAGPYFLGSGLDTGPVPSLPMLVSDLNMRPSLHRSNITTSLDYMPPATPLLADPDMHYSYPSPGLSNGLNSLALAACEHRRLSEEKAQSRSPRSEQETPSGETPTGTSP
ncbi:hypothetical protein BDY17DRAFT_126767 [Neohortaea acidophila]|uniref:C2H2 type master regulator of conidiophore development brlA n=1 Tax=Neohortaea acidophila TaxID=245834 RepID=A0A6A6PYS0_9PEZI|nr:uncharacterized protein BDY17DRAFT_126767 [Neohortaea acidophila]KAF2484357.1 hypothetical protein BDY17DRAFT_126767 [Neohortaea acidophila]